MLDALTAAVPELEGVKDRNPDFDLLSFDFTDADAVAGLDLGRGDNAATLEVLKAYQRLGRVYPSAAVATALAGEGFHSAQQIAAVEEGQWVRQVAGALGGDTRLAREAHRRARAIKGHATHLWANAATAIRSPLFRRTRGNTIPDSLVTYFESLPTYADLFGSTDYCSCASCRSVLGPAAYFIDLMRITDRYVTRPNADTIPNGMKLEDRRPGLFTDVTTSCADTNDLVPYLQVVNEVLAGRAAGELKVDDVDAVLATAIYPFVLPQNLPLSRIRLLLGELGLATAGLYESFAHAAAAARVAAAQNDTVTFTTGVPATAAAKGAVVRVLSGPAAGAVRLVTAYDPSTRAATLDAPWTRLPTADTAVSVEPGAWPPAREALSLSVEQAAFAATPTPTPAALKPRWGLPDDADLRQLAELPLFLRRSGLERQALQELLREELDGDEIEKGLAHGLFIDQALADGGYVQVVTPDTGPQRLEPLDAPTLDRIGRFVRLAEWTGIPFAELGWTLASFGETEISAGALAEVAAARGAAAALGLPYDVVSALWADMKTIGRGPGPEPADLFDRVFNAPAVRDGGAVYRPLYPPNPLFTDPVATWKVDGAEVEGGFGRARLLAALGLRDAALTDAATLLFGEGAEVPLDVPNLTRLYRTSVLLGLTGLEVEDYARLLAWLGLDPRGPFAPAGAVRLVLAAKWMDTLGAAPADVAFVVDGRPVPDPGGAVQEPSYDGMRATWQVALPLYFGPASFLADTIASELSRAIYGALLDPAGSAPVLALGADYAAVFGGAAPQVALVRRPVTAADLAGVIQKLGLDAVQTGVVQSALNAVFTAQVQFATGQLATTFGVEPDLAAAALGYVAAAGVGDWLETYLRPVAERSGEWRAVRGLFRDLSRVLLGAALLGADAATVAAVAARPADFGIADPAAPGFEGLRRLASFDALARRLGGTRTLLELLAMPSDPSCAGGAKGERLSELAGWPEGQLCQVLELLGAGPSLYDTVPGIIRLEGAFGGLSAGGFDPAFAAALLALRDLPASGGEGGGNWKRYVDTAWSLAGVAAARLGTAAWARARAKVDGALLERRRDALEPLVLWQLGPRGVTDRRQLYGFLLIDVEISACADTSRIVEGISAVQTYLQRARLGLEPGVERIAIPGAWWEWLASYRVWEANRKIFLFPENYLEPSLRSSRTDLFRELQEALQQTNITETTIERAYAGYLGGLEKLSTLVYVDAHRCVVDDPRRGPVDTLFVFARTRDEPYAFYWATLEDGAVWSQWQPVAATVRSPYLTPVYAFGRLLVFWVELKEVSSTQIRADNGASVSQNSNTWMASIRYSFRDATGTWVAAQTLFEEETAYVAPTAYPFDNASGYDLFNLTALFWRKCNALRVSPDRLSAPAVGAGQGEKLVVFYGPFLENDVTGSPLKPVDRPSRDLATQEPARYRFSLEVYNRIGMVNQAAQSRARGVIPLQRARVLNRDLNHDFLMRQTEFYVLVQNRSAGVPPAVRPLIDVPTSALYVADTLNPLRTNYYGDWTPAISSAEPPRRVTAKDFILPGINAARSAQVLADLKGIGVVDDAGVVSPTFTTNTDLSSVLAGLPDRESLVAEVQMILLDLRARGKPADASSFLLDEITATLAAQVLADLVGGGVVSDTGKVTPTLTSRTDLSFVLDGYPEPQKGRLLFEIRRVLLSRLGSPLLLGQMARENSATVVVKNQPGWFIADTGSEAFRVVAEGPDLPQLSSTLRVREMDSPQRVTPLSFVTPNINETLSGQAFKDLVGAGVIEEDGVLNPGFGPTTDLSFLFAGTEPLLAAEVRRVLLDLPTLTTLSWFSENDDFVVTVAALRTLGIGEAGAAAALAALQQNGVVDAAGIVSRRFGDGTDLSFLYPDAGSRRELLIADTRALLRGYFSATWERTVHDLRFRFGRYTTGAVARLAGLLTGGGISRLLSLDSQLAPVVPLIPFSRYAPQPARVTGPALFDGAQVDFDGPYGLYYWELFFFTPQLVAPTLAAAGRYQDALRWQQYVFDPTVRPEPVTWQSLVTPDIPEAEAKAAFALLVQNGVVTARGGVEEGFGPDTDLSFLFTDVRDPAVRGLMIREVRNVLLNHAVSTPAGFHWRFLPFRRHTLRSLLEDITDPAQVRVYERDPFDPFAVARLRIGAFEKSAFMGYVNTLLEWGDSLFTQKTREALAAATLLYVYADELLGPRPVDTGPCKTARPTTFDRIRAEYAGDPNGIPPFLIELEHVLPPTSDAADALAAAAFQDVEPVFCVPENEMLLGLWDRVADRMFKLRHCLDLEGKPLVLPLFAPPIDPLALVRAAAAGGQGGMGPLPQMQAAVPAYRYAPLVIQARSVLGDLTSLGTALLSALGQRDGEALARLRATQEQVVLNLTTRIKTLQVEEADSQLAALRKSREALASRRAFYNGLVQENISPAEIAHLTLSSAALLTNVAAGIAEAAAAIAYTVPQVGAPTALTYGGIQAGNSATRWAAVFNVATKGLEFGAQTSLTVAGYQRRKQEWEREVTQADFDIAQADLQIAAATNQAAIARRDLEVHQKTLEQNQAYADFLLRRFDSQELFAWMAARLSTLYYQTYRLALDATLAAQSAWQYELNRTDVFVNFAAWDEGRRGLLSGEALTLSLDQMEAAYFRDNRRALELTRTVSLAETAPLELLRLRTEGAADLDLTEALFDFDFPGHYARRIKTVELTLATDAEEEIEIHATVAQTRNAFLATPDRAGLAWMVKGTWSDPPASVRMDWQSNQVIAVSTSVDGSGLWELNLGVDDRLYPFEGTGAVSRWTISMPRDTNRFDFSTITDLRVKVRYSALDGGKELRDEARRLLGGPRFRAGAVIPLATAFAEAWTAFMDDHATPDAQTLSVPIDTTLLLPNLAGFLLDSVAVTLQVAPGVTLPASATFLTLAAGELEPVEVTLQRGYGVVDTGGAAQARWTGEWTLTADLAAMRKDAALAPLLDDGFLNPDTVLDLELALDYRAAAFPAS